MADLAAERHQIQTEETRFPFAIAESAQQKIGKAINFINTKQYDTKDFFANGVYNSTGANETAFDGLYVFPYNVTIFYVAMFNVIAGSGGTTEIDIKVTPSSGTTFTTIFSTRPKISTTADHTDVAYIYTGGSGTGLTAPVLTGTTFNVNAGSAIRADFISKQTGSPQNCGILVYFYPR